MSNETKICLIVSFGISCPIILATLPSLRIQRSLLFSFGKHRLDPMLYHHLLLLELLRFSAYAAIVGSIPLSKRKEASVLIGVFGCFTDTYRIKIGTFKKDRSSML
jgi:hypothetical protein